MDRHTHQVKKLKTQVRKDQTSRTLLAQHNFFFLQAFIPIHHTPSPSSSKKKAAVAYHHQKETTTEDDGQERTEAKKGYVECMERKTFFLFWSSKTEYSAEGTEKRLCFLKFWIIAKAYFAFKFLLLHTRCVWTLLLLCIPNFFYLFYFTYYLLLSLQKQHRLPPQQQK